MPPLWSHGYLLHSLRLHSREVIGLTDLMWFQNLLRPDNYLRPSGQRIDVRLAERGMGSHSARKGGSGLRTGRSALSFHVVRLDPMFRSA